MCKTDDGYVKKNTKNKTFDSRCKVRWGGCDSVGLVLFLKDPGTSFEFVTLQTQIQGHFSSIKLSKLENGPRFVLSDRITIQNT